MTGIPGCRSIAVTSLSAGGAAELLSSLLMLTVLLNSFQTKGSLFGEPNGRRVSGGAAYLSYFSPFSPTAESVSTRLVGHAFSIAASVAIHFL